mmetsp:Transcript_6715/g.10037  ORF Transcript_6715/g.10037 Transcript_6715/m.10037 type:complete len:87 (+) Transcript_6715:228-488(+)
MNIQRHRRSNVNASPRNIKMFEDDLRIDQQDVLVNKGLHDFSPRGSAACTTRRTICGPLRGIAATDEDKLSESIEAILAGIMFDAE